LATRAAVLDELVQRRSASGLGRIEQKFPPNDAKPSGIRRPPCGTRSEPSFARAPVSATAALPPWLAAGLRYDRFRAPVVHHTGQPRLRVGTRNADRPLLRRAFSR